MNSMINKHNAIMLMVLGMLVILSLWMQFVLLDSPEFAANEDQSNDPDYYVENFTSTGVDAQGKQYQLEADRLVHYPVGNKALLDNPHVIQILKDTGPTHIYANSGWLFGGGSEILLTDNVKVIRSQGQKLGGAATTQRMRIKLKPDNE